MLSFQCRALPFRTTRPGSRVRYYRIASCLRSEGQAKQAATDTHALLSKCTWSVKSLIAEIPPSLSDAASSSGMSGASPQTPSITAKQLHHLLRLSALPAPASASEEHSMLATLETQLRFVRDVQAVDTAGVEPLQAIRDETAAGIRERTVGLESLRDAFAEEVIVGKSRRPKRRMMETISAMGKDGKTGVNPAEDWDALAMAKRKVGDYFVVNSSKE